MDAAGSEALETGLDVFAARGVLDELLKRLARADQGATVRVRGRNNVVVGGIWARFSGFFNPVDSSIGALDANRAITGDATKSAAFAHSDSLASAQPDALPVN